MRPVLVNPVVKMRPLLASYKEVPPVIIYLHKREMFGRFNRVQLEEDIGNWTVYRLMNINEAGIDITVDSETQFNEGSSLE